jgi:hypothetical protein
MPTKFWLFRFPILIFCFQLSLLGCHLQKGSGNREKLKRKISRLHYRISCIRHDALNQLTCLSGMWIQTGQRRKRRPQSGTVSGFDVGIR